MWGSFLWVMFDFASAGRHEGDTDGINDKGLVTRDRQVKKDAFFFYRANWNPDPMVYITSRRDDQRTSPATAIKIYSNCDKVTLKINGKSQGELTKKADYIYVRDGVTLTVGTNLIEADGTSPGKVAHDLCTWIYKPGAAKGD
jgi:beta-galactosidase